MISRKEEYVLTIYRVPVFIATLCGGGRLRTKRYVLAS
jgi:hypothetical protein